MIPVITRPPDPGVPATSVVLIDDDSDFRWVVRRALERDGSYVVAAEASNGLAGVETVAHHDPGVVLLDIDLPRLDGVSTLRLIRQQSPDTRVVVLTGSSSPARLQAARTGGAVGVIRKGASRAGLLAQLRGLLDAEPGPSRVPGQPT